MPSLSILRIGIAALLAVLWLGVAQAQVALPPDEGEAAEDVEQVSPDPLNRETPRGMVAGLIDALASGDMERARSYVDLSSLPEARRDELGSEAVAALETVLDRSGEIVPSYRLSTDPTGIQDDGLAADLDVFAEIRLPGQQVDLTARRTTGPDGNPIWLVSPEALETARDLADETPVSLVDQLTPEAWADLRYGGAPLGHWIALVVLAALSFALARLLGRVLFWAAGRIWSPLHGDDGRRLMQAVALPLGVLIALALFSTALRISGISIVARAYVAPVAEILFWLALGALAWRAVDGLSAIWLDSMSRRGRLGSVSVVTLLRRAAKVLIGVLAAIAIFNSLGVDLTGWLAAFGLGGLAIALGAQKTIEHFVGSVSLVADRPMRIGDFCQVDGLLGTIEDIGMRSTRIRTLERTLVTIPNGIMSGARIENYASRDKFLYKRILTLRYETTPDQMRNVLRRLRELLEADPRVTDDPGRVRFINFGSSSLDIEVFAYVVALDYDTFLEAAEELNLSIMDIVAECGTSFAFPSQTVYLETGTGSEAPAGGTPFRMPGDGGPKEDGSAPHPQTRGS